MGQNRYFIPQLPTSSSIELSPEEVHHAVHVRREAVGNRCIAFDGLGNVAECRFIRIEARTATVEIESHRFEPNELPGKLTLAVAFPKGDRQKSVIEKAVELGVHEIIPLICERSISQPREHSADKWMRIVIESCKQCERNQLLRIGAPCTFQNLLSQRGETHSNPAVVSHRVFAHPASESSSRSIDLSDKCLSIIDRPDIAYTEVTIAIGPEGGFSASEVADARAAQWGQLDLGPRILRVETAVSVAAIYGSMLLLVSRLAEGVRAN